DKAAKKWPWIRRPNMVLPITAHPAFDKAGHLFGVKLRKVAVDEDGLVNPKDMARKINRNTILLVGSAPQYVSGAVDPIPEIGALGLKKGIPVHVDACFGGFLQPWLERLGVQMPMFDFRVPGVMSMSADAHKYGFAAKGASVILYRHLDDLKYQFFISTDWPGGIYASPSLPGPRPGGSIAACWAALQSLGEDGYLERAKVAWDGAERLRRGIDAIPELRVMGRPMSTIVTWTSDTVDVYAVADQLQEKGWTVDRQQSPPSVHCTVNASNLPVMDTYLSDVREALAKVAANPSLAREGDAAMYGLMAKVPLRGLVVDSIRDVMAGWYAPDAGAASLGGDDTDGLMGFVNQHSDKVHKVLDAVNSARASIGGTR
ncbi:MAG: aminotransferase class V-fold PLP-dependent enzyme, partial [Rhodobacterales bacterium]|nr:aminotransferase class V-fold PLP-dependent enzyme [Rhodobacterales bacterium]